MERPRLSLLRPQPAVIILFLFQINLRSPRPLSYWPNAASKHQALALGLGSLFNHSRLHQNIGWKRDIPNTCIAYTALRDIAFGEELCISYGDLWFEDADDRAQHETINGNNSIKAAGEAVNEDDRKAELILSGLGDIAIDTDGDEPGHESCESAGGS